MEKSQKIKVTVAVVLLLAAIGLVAWWFTSSNSSSELEGVVTAPEAL